MSGTTLTFMPQNDTDNTDRRPTLNKRTMVMLSLIEERGAQIAVLCRRFHVRRLDVFGSAARGDFDPARSDIDFLVEFEPLQPGAYVDAFFDLKEGLEQLFGRPVDLVSAASIRNPYFRQSVERTKALLYAA
jgi:predicted nucleotidyltransferase